MTAAETRQAAFAARAQADPGRLASEVEQALDRALLPRLRELTAAVSELSRTAKLQGDARTHAEEQLLDMKRDLHNARADALRWKAYVGGALLGGLLLAMALTFALPRIVPATPFTCRLAGGLWLSNETGQRACTFWEAM